MNFSFGELKVRGRLRGEAVTVLNAMHTSIHALTHTHYLSLSLSRTHAHTHAHTGTPLQEEETAQDVVNNAQRCGLLAMPKRVHSCPADFRNMEGDNTVLEERKAGEGCAGECMGGLF